MDMTNDVFADLAFGQIAIRKLAPVDPNFRLYKAGWLGDPQQSDVMEVTGALFRQALRGPNKGQLSIKVPGTSRTVHVTAQEIASIKAKNDDRLQEVAEAS